MAAWRGLPLVQGGRPAGPALESLDVYRQVPPFSLIERSGHSVRREDLFGHVWVANFIYTQCKETCPTQSLQIARRQAEFASAEDLRFVSITVDPEHDTLFGSVLEPPRLAIFPTPAAIAAVTIGGLVIARGERARELGKPARFGRIMRFWLGNAWVPPRGLPCGW